MWTQNDISFAVNFLARFTTRPTERLIRAAKRVFRYVKGTKLKGIQFSARPPSGRTSNTLYAYADTSDAD
eukprot:3171688-Rhodomonas_salina.2